MSLLSNRGISICKNEILAGENSMFQGAKVCGVSVILGEAASQPDSNIEVVPCIYLLQE